MIDFEDRAAVERLVGEVEDEASNFHKFRSYVQYFSPFTPTFDTPYRPYVDIYRALRSGDYERAAEGIGTVGLPDGSAVTADQATAVGLERWVAGDSLNADGAFLRLYGREFFALTGSMTKNLTGIPPTLQAWDQSQVHHDLIVNHPEWASVIVGTDAGGEAQKFSRAVYDAQFAAGDRVPISLQEQVDDYQVRLGWENYSRFMDLYDSTKVELGVTSNSDPRLDPLNAQRRALVDRLAEVYPEWYREYSAGPVTRSAGHHRRVGDHREPGPRPTSRHRRASPMARRPPVHPLPTRATPLHVHHGASEPRPATTLGGDRIEDRGVEPGVRRPVPPEAGTDRTPHQPAERLRS